MSKLRITTYNADHTINVDRLVEARTEFYNGPDHIHDGGGVRIDALLENNEELEGFIEYLSKFLGKLPLGKKEKKSQSQIIKPLAADSITKLIDEAFTKCKTQEALLDYLRELNFALVTYDHLQDICEANGFKFKLKVGKENKTLHTDYQWMVRQLKLAKNPVNDKYDLQICFGFKIIGEKRPKVVIYKDGKYLDSKELHWKEAEEIGFKVKEKFYKFPEPMSYKERANWRAEDRKVLFDPNKGTDTQYQPSSFYLKWQPYVTILKPQRAKKRRK